MEKDLLVICPTRERPDSCARMIESFKKKSSSCADLIFIVDHDDAWFKEYEHIFKNTNFQCFIREYCTLCEMYNMIVCEWFSKYKFYSITCDDFIYHTGSWDRILINKLKEEGGGFAYGDDDYGGQILPTTCVISAEIIKALGWIVQPSLKYLCGDLVWRDLGQQLNRLFYIPEVKIEHMTPLARKAEIDDTHLRTNSKESYSIDNAAYRLWKKINMQDDVETIKEALCNQK